MITTSWQLAVAKDLGKLTRLETNIFDIDDIFVVGRTEEARKGGKETGEQRE